jgi:hypothetical protein
MRVRPIVLLAVMIVASSASISGQQAPGGGQLTVSPWFPAVHQAGSFALIRTPSKTASTLASLFIAPLPAQAIGQPASQPQTIVCGMTLIPADPKMDAAIRRVVPENGPTFKIKTLEPPDCRR